MTLLLTNEEIESLLSMGECIDALEQAYIELGEGRAVAVPRTDALSPGSCPEQVYMLKTMSGIAPQLGIGGIRINSNILSWPTVDGGLRRVKVPATADKKYVGLVLIFSIETGETLAIFLDGAMQRLRVAATNGIALKHLAKAEAATLALFGTGNQAATQLLAAAAVRRLTRVQCFSPNRHHRESFAGRMREKTGLDVVAVNEPDDALNGADIVMCATNSLSPVFDPRWLRAGLHLSAIRWHEFSTATIRQADRTFIHSRDSDPLHFKTRNLTFPDDSDRKGGAVAEGLDIDALPTLSELLTARAPGRRTPDEITCFINNHGLGYQFAVLGALAYRAALRCQCGRSLPGEWFTQDIPP